MRHLVTPERLLWSVPEPRERALLAPLARRLDALQEAVLSDRVHGWRRGRSVSTAVAHIERLHSENSEWAGLDIHQFFTSVDPGRLLHTLHRLDVSLARAVAPWLRDGLPEGCPISPPLANLYVSSIDHRFNAVRWGDNYCLVYPPDELEGAVRRLVNHLTNIDLQPHEIWLRQGVFCGVQMCTRTP